MRGLLPTDSKPIEAILDLLDVGVGCMDLEGRVQVWNRVAEQLSGWNREEVIGSTVDRMVPQHVAGRRDVIARTLAEGQVAGTYSRVHKDGTVYRLEMRYHLLRDKQGEPHCIVAVAEPLAGHGLSLTPRQKEVLGYIAAGRTNDHIARTLVVSRRTVERHVADILDKFRVENRAAAAAIGVAAGLARPKASPV
jgi:PAS domain S-box-containing protein